MGPPPRSLTAEANSCFMVRVLHGPNRIQGCGASIAPERGLPSDQLYRTSNNEGHRVAVTLDTKVLIQGCVKTCTSRECSELFSLFSSFDGDCQSGSLVIRGNRDKLSTRKFDVGVFTQPGPNGDIDGMEFFHCESRLLRTSASPLTARLMGLLNLIQSGELPDR